MVIHPTLEEMKDFKSLVANLDDNVKKHTCKKIVPPEGWMPERDIDKQLEHFPIHTPIQQCAAAHCRGAYSVENVPLAETTFKSFKARATNRGCFPLFATVTCFGNH